MLRDASQKQVIHKFSFIESLDLSERKKFRKQPTSAEVDLERAFNFIPEVNSQPSSPVTASAMVATNTPVAESAVIARSNPDFEAAIVSQGLQYYGSPEVVFSHRDGRRNYLGKILFALATSYCLFVLWWLFGHQANRLLVSLMGGKHITLSQGDMEFLDYMERSLATLESQAAKEKDSASEKGVVYVPVYTPKNTAPSFPQVFSGNLPTTSTPTTPKASAPTPPSETLKIPAPPPLPAPTPLAESSPEQKATVAVKPKIKHTHTLIGILDLGAGKSAALIKVNGQTRRFWQGEEISSSGWVLESIANQTAKVNHQGEVRSIAVGDSF